MDEQTQPPAGQPPDLPGAGLSLYNPDSLAPRDVPPIQLLTLSEAAKAISQATGLHVKAWHIRRLFQRHILREAPRVGRQRVIPEVSLPLVRMALIKAGYLHEGQA